MDVTVQTILPLLLGLEQHRVNDISLRSGSTQKPAVQNDNNTCSEVSHHGSFDSIVMMCCVNVPDQSEHNMSIPEKILDESQQTMACVSAKSAIGPPSTAHNLHGDRN